MDYLDPGWSLDYFETHGTQYTRTVGGELEYYIGGEVKFYPDRFRDTDIFKSIVIKNGNMTFILNEEAVEYIIIEGITKQLYNKLTFMKIDQSVFAFSLAFCNNQFTSLVLDNIVIRHNNCWTVNPERKQKNG